MLLFFFSPLLLPFLLFLLLFVQVVLLYSIIDFIIIMFMPALAITRSSRASVTSFCYRAVRTSARLPPLRTKGTSAPFKPNQSLLSCVNRATAARNTATARYTATMATRIVAAFDIGSGKTKMDVVEVHDNVVLRTLFSEQRNVPFARYFEASLDNTLSAEVLDMCRAAIAEFKDVAQKHGAESLFGVATQVFRRAANGEAFLKELREVYEVQVFLATQRMEGILGFRTALAASGITDVDRVVSYDSGAASFQICVALDHRGTSLDAYEAPWGAMVAFSKLVTVVRKHPYDPHTKANPVEPNEALALVEYIMSSLEPCDPAVQSRIDTCASLDIPIAAYGDVTSIFSMASIACKSRDFTPSTLRDALLSACNQTTEQLAEQGFPTPEYVVPKLCLFYAVVSFTRMKQINFTPSNGNCLGIAISEADILQLASTSPPKVSAT
eukprot:m.49371 g.49371  ORF g.49371 m.49371 type:complete len:441 (+) comp11090_c0_seq1:359-1681(+)